MMKKAGLLIVFVCLVLSPLSCKGIGPVAKNVLNVGSTFLQAVAANYTGQYTAVVNTFVQALGGEESSFDAGEAEYDPAQEQAEYDPAQEQGDYGEIQGQGAYDQPLTLPLALDVAILKKTSGNYVIPIEDGAVLRDGRGDPRRGDQFKITFRANTNCYVYVVAADATGYVEPVFPHSDDYYRNPVVAGVQYEIPRSATSSWFGLDDYRGIETLFFVASRERRSDLDIILKDLLSRREQRRPVNQTVAVSEPMVISSAPITQGLPGKCNTRGIVRVSDCLETRGIVRVTSQQASVFQDLNAGGSMSISAGNGRAYEYSPETFMISGTSDLVFTRWFRHE